MADTNDKLLSTIVIDGVEYKISDEMVQDILGIIYQNNTAISSRINDLNSRLTTLEGITPITTETDPIFSASAAAGITSGNITAWNSYQTNVIESISVNGTTQTPSNKNIALTIPSEVTESTVAGWGFTKNNGTLTSETDPIFSASAAAGITAGNISAWNSYQTNVIESISVNGATQTITNKNAELSIPLALSENYETSSLTNEDLLLETGDSFETAFSKMEKTIIDNEEVSATALNDLNSRVVVLEAVPPFVESDPIFNASAAAGITSGNIDKWNSYANIIESIKVNGVTQTPSNKSIALTIPSTNGLATTQYVDTAVAGVVNSAPETLDTLNELATALGNDPNFATTVSNQIGTKVSKTELSGLGYLQSETDPVFSASAAAGITSGNISAWNSYQTNIIESITVNGTTQTPTDKNVALTIPAPITESTVAGWGFTKNTGTLTGETDPVFSASAAAGITAGNISAWNSYQTNVIESITVNGATQTITNKNIELTISYSLTVDGFGDTYYDLIDNSITNDDLLLEVGDTFEAAFAKLQRTILDNEEVSSAAMINLNSRITTLENDNSAITTETDPIFIASVAAGITSGNISAWNSYQANVIESITVNGTTQTPSNKNIALTIPSAVTESTVSGWGFTKNTGTLTTETDPVFTASAAAGITAGNITAWNSYQTNIIESITVNGTTQTPSNKNIALTIPSTNGLATTQYVDTAVAGIVNSAPETLDTLNELAAALGNDPNFATTISNQIGTKVSKTELSGLGYLQSETDPVFSASAAHGITAGNITNWNTYQANKIESITVNGTTQTPSNKNIALTIPSAVTESTVAGWGFTKNTGTLTTETDPVFSASAAHGITAGNITNWNSYQANVIEAVTFNGATATVTNKVAQITTPVIPNYSSADAGKILSVNSSGQLVWVTPVNIYSGNTAPNNSQGNNDDIYLQI